MEKFDLIIIGGGPAGYEAAELAGRRGLRTALIEGDKLGGVCLNCGCIPLKGYLHLAHMKEAVKDFQRDHILTDYGVLHVNQSYVVRRNQQIIEKLRQGIEHKLKNTGVTLYRGNAYISSVDKEVNIIVNELLLTAKDLIIATGSQSRKIFHANQGVGYQIIYDNQLFQLTSIPHKILIVGAGAVGLEAACYFNAVGCEVIVMDEADQIGGRLDTGIAEVYRKILEHKGIRIYTESRVRKFDTEEILVEIRGQEVSLKTEVVLIAVGRIPVIQGFGLEESGINYNKEGIVIDNACRTNKRNVYACGDVTGQCMLAHVAYEQARVAVSNLIGEKADMNYDIIPRIIYSEPEVMTVGLSEDECVARNIQYITKELPLTYSGKYFIEHKNDGARAKMIVETQLYTVIGFSMIGDGASEIALAVEMMIANQMRIEDVSNLVFPHPTVGEIMRELTRLFISKRG